MLRLAAALAALLLPLSAAHAQGILTVTPGRTASTAAGTGTVGYSGDGGVATSATLADPAAVAYDTHGNLFIADANNHVIREINRASGVITTVAGSGIAGFAGDGGAATSALLDTPTGIAVDTSGNLYIADSHNQRIREVSGGTITTIAGNGTKGFAGDGAAATAAELALPSAVAVDLSGNVYIADTNNQRIRKITGTTISTIAGTGEQNYTGDNAAATAATLDSPTGVAVDAFGNVYIADRHNQRIREVSASGTISTLAGSGTPTFAGGFAGDGASATAAALAKPTGVSVDAFGNVTIADTNNQRIRQVANGAVATIVGTGGQGFGGDGGPATAAILNAPKAAAPDASGNLAIADTLDQRIRSGLLPTIAFGSQVVGVATSGQPVTLANTGSASIAVSSIAFTGAFSTVSGGTCSATPITLAAGASCTVDIAFLPAAIGSSSGAVVFGGTGVASQTILLAGTGTPSSTTTTLTTSNPTPLVNQPVTFTATVKPTGTGTPTGTITFYANGTLLGTPQTLSGGTASLTTAFTTAGSYAITAVYSGDMNFGGSTSAAITELIGDFNFAISGSPTSQTVEPGKSATYSFTVSPLNGPFTFPIVLSATGLPPGATVTFNPSSVTLGGSSANFTMIVQTAATTGMVDRLGGVTGSTTAFALLLVPFALRVRRRGRRARKIHPLLMLFVCLLGFASMAALSGCGSEHGFFAQEPQTYTITVTGTATASNGATLQHSIPVTLTVE